MNLSSLKRPQGSRKKGKRVGRGDASGHGGTSCKGHKGQNARSGGKVRPGFEGGQMPLSRRLPKRGFTNIFKREVAIINISQLQGFPPGSVIDGEGLAQRGLVNKKGAIKLLGKGQIDHPVTVRLSAVSKSARAKIEAAGGTVIEGN